MYQSVKKEKLFDCAAIIITPYKCGQCLNFENHFLGNVKRHISEEHKPRIFNNPVYKCKNCNFVTYSRYLSLRHNSFDKCKADDTNKSDVSNDSFKSRSNEERIFVCGKTSRKSDFTEHIVRKKHASLDKEKYRLTMHIAQKHKKEIPSNSATSNQQDLERHILLKDTSNYRKKRLKRTSEQKKPFKCPHCDFRTSWSISVKAHITAKHIPEDMKVWFYCDHCEFRTLQKYKVKQHITCKHTSEDTKKWYHCDQCDFKTSYNESLKQHIKCKHIPKDMKKWYHCDQCEFKSSYSRYLKMHVINKHSPENMKKWYYCDQCEYRTVYSQSLKPHITYNHTPEDMKKWYHCDQCEHKTLERWCLKRHIACKHNPGNMNNTWYRCDQCEYKTKNSLYIKQHITSKHTHLFK